MGTPVKQVRTTSRCSLRSVGRNTDPCDLGLPRNTTRPLSDGAHDRQMMVPPVREIDLITFAQSPALGVCEDTNNRP